MTDMQTWLTNIVEVCERNADMSKEFLYLGGPMTHYPQLNFPRFNEVAKILRARGYNIVSPSELDDSEAEIAALASLDGEDSIYGGFGWSDFLARDIVICSMPYCLGAIFIEGWENSEGASLESYVIDRLGKPCYVYDDSSGTPILTVVSRDEALRHAVH